MIVKEKITIPSPSDFIISINSLLDDDGNQVDLSQNYVRFIFYDVGHRPNHFGRFLYRCRIFYGDRGGYYDRCNRLFDVCFQERGFSTKHIQKQSLERFLVEGLRYHSDGLWHLCYRINFFWYFYFLCVKIKIYNSF